MKIIITDDEADIRSMVKYILTKRGFEVITDSTGERLDHLGKDLPDLIILDINLENRSGADICVKLKSDPHTKHIPIILISAIMDLKGISQHCGAEDYIVKPFTASALEYKIDHLTGQAA